MSMFAVSSLLLPWRFCFCFPFILVQIRYRRVYVESTNDISDGLEGNIGISGRDFVELCVQRIEDAIVFHVCALTFANSDLSCEFSQIGSNYWIRLCALTGQIFYYWTWKEHATALTELAPAKTDGRTVDWLTENQLWKTVDSITTCKRAAMRNWTARSVRNYSCKLGVCTRGKQARSRNFRNLMEIKLCFYIQLAL